MLYGGDTSNAAVVVPCLSRQCALRVYAALASNAGRMGYPAKVVPADLVAQSERFVNDAAKESFMLKQAEAASMAGRYPFIYFYLFSFSFLLLYFSSCLYFFISINQLILTHTHNHSTTMMSRCVGWLSFWVG